MDKCIGAQFFTIRKSIQNISDFESSCKKIAEIGYKLVQISGTPLKASEMRPILDTYGLKVVTTHRGFQDFVNDIDEIIDYNKTLGCDLCGVGMMPLEYASNRKKLDTFLGEANKACEELKKEKMYFGYHNHSFEFTRIDGKNIYDYLVNETDPERFRFILDTYWVQEAGKNPVKLIKSLGERAMAVHFKDLCIDPAKYGEPQMAEIGNGNLEWDDIISACEEAGVKWALVEQDTCKRDPFESLKISYEYLKNKGFC